MGLGDLPPDSLLARQHADALGRLFDLIESSYLFVKDREHRFVRCNRALWLKHGLESEDAMLGKQDEDFHPPALAKAYVEEDRSVMETGNPVIDSIWLVPSSGALRWYRCSKLPMVEGEGAGSRVVGVAGILRPYDGEGAAPAEYDRVKPALARANREFGDGVKVSDLASTAGYSVNQFARVFQRLFQMKPIEYLRRLRIEEASRLLRSTRLSMCDIALRCGFYDQSAFSKSFRESSGVTPKRYRDRFGVP